MSFQCNLVDGSDRRIVIENLKEQDKGLAMLLQAFASVFQQGLLRSNDFTLQLEQDNGFHLRVIDGNPNLESHAFSLKDNIAETFRELEQCRPPGTTVMIDQDQHTITARTKSDLLALKMLLQNVIFFSVPATLIIIL
jgi:hypothetical protein